MSDDAITRDQLEAIGFRRGAYGFHIRGLLFVDTTIRGCPVYIGSVTSGAESLDKITTMKQLDALIKALNGQERTDDREKLDAEYAAQVAECVGDPESGHMLADSLLLELLAKLGMTKTVKAFQRLTKWYT